MKTALGRHTVRLPKLSRTERQTAAQKAMNDRAAKYVGKMGDDARAAQKGELKSSN